MYEILLEHSVKRFLKKIPVRDFNRIIPDLKALSENPRPSGCNKLTGSKRDWRIRVGSYRIIYEIDDAEKVIRVMRIGNRRNIYR